MVDGEEIGLLFYDPYPYPTSNKGYFTIHPQGLFKAKGTGGYTNGDIYTKTDKSLFEIGQMLAQLYQAAPACPFDVAPDAAATDPAGVMPPAPSSGSANPQQGDSVP